MYICYFQKIQLFDQLIVLQDGQLNGRFRTKLFKIENIIFDQVFVQTIIHYVLQYFGKAWEHRYWSIVTYKIVVTVITLIN